MILVQRPGQVQRESREASRRRCCFPLVPGGPNSPELEGRGALAGRMERESGARRIGCRCSHQLSLPIVGPGPLRPCQKVLGGGGEKTPSDPTGSILGGQGGNASSGQVGKPRLLAFDGIPESPCSEGAA